MRRGNVFLRRCASRRLCCTRLRDACSALRARTRPRFPVAQRAAMSSRTASARSDSRHFKRASYSAIPNSWYTAFGAQRLYSGRCSSIYANVDSMQKIAETTAWQSLKPKSCIPDLQGEFDAFGALSLYRVVSPRPNFRHLRQHDFVAVLREFRHVITTPLVKRHIPRHQRVRR